MTAKVLIDRVNKAVRVEVEKVIDAGWLGHKFAFRHRSLAAEWSIICYKPGDLPSIRVEEHYLNGPEITGFTETTEWVDVIAEWIENPRDPCCHHCCCTR